MRSLRLFFLFNFLTVAKVFATPSSLHFQAKILNSSNQAVESSNVTFVFTYLNSTQTCTLYKETFSSVDMTASNGIVDIKLGSGARTWPTSGSTTVQDIFNNIGTTFTCLDGSTYTSSSVDVRYLVMQFNYSGSGGWNTLEALSINSVPYSMYATNSEQLGGKSLTDFILKPAVCTSGQVLSYDGSSYVCTTSSGGSITSSTIISALGYTPVQPSNNLSDITSATIARSNLGLGTVATLNVGTNANNIVQIDSSGKLPALDASQLTGLTSSQLASATAYIRGGNSFEVASIIGLNRSTTASSNGYNLTVKAGGTTAGTSNGAGGNLILSSGESTGWGSSSILFQISPSSVSATTDNSFVTKMAIDSTGVGFGTVSPSYDVHLYAAKNSLETLMIENGGSSSSAGEALYLHQNGTGLTQYSSGYSDVTRANNLELAANSGSSLFLSNGASIGVTLSSNQQVGIGTTTPWNSLTIEGSDNVDNGIGISVSNTSSGTQAWAGYYMFNSNSDYSIHGVTSPNYSSLPILQNMAFIQNSSTLNGFIIMNDGNKPIIFATQDAEQMRVHGNGNVGIGVSNPTTKLQVAGEIAPSVDNAYQLGDASFRFTKVYAVNGAIQTSDRNLKKQIQNLDLGLDFINDLKPVRYKWKSGEDQKFHFGLIAQDTLVVLQKYGAAQNKTEVPVIDYDQKNNRYGLNYTELISPIIKAIQELVEKLNNKIDKSDLIQLQIENEKLKKENQAIKSYLCERDPQASLCLAR